MNCPKCGAPLEQYEILDQTYVHSCPQCSGAFYPEGALAVHLQPRGDKPTQWTCPGCAGALRTAKVYDGHLELDFCSSCGGIWFDAGEVESLRQLAGAEQIVKPVGAAFEFEEPEATPEAKPGATPPAAGKPAPPKAKKKAAPAAATDDEGSPEIERSNSYNADANNAPTVKLGGRTYEHFQTSAPVTTYVLGEFPWVAKVGDTVQMRDFISPPFVLSEEISKDEAVWTQGEYVEPAEVWAAFQLPGSPPPTRGIAPAQPNEWAENMPSMWAAFAVAAAVCVGSYIWRAQSALERVVFQTDLVFASTDPEKSRVTDVFEVPGGVSNVELLLDTNLDNHWAYFDVALIEADTDRAYDFGQELSYYHGFEDGENWSEGTRRETLYVPRVPAGRYYLRLEPETDVSPLPLHVRVRRDVPLFRLPMTALLLLILPPLFAWFRWRAFEQARWVDSDHPRATGGSDE